METINIVMIKTHEQYRELLEQRLDELNFGRFGKAIAGGAVALGGIAGMQFGASHVTPQETTFRSTTQYTTPYSGAELNAKAKEMGSDTQFGNFPAHSSRTTLTRMGGYDQGEGIPHSVRGFFDAGDSTQWGAAATTKPPSETFTQSITTPDGQAFDYNKLKQAGMSKKHGSMAPFDTTNADFLDNHTSTSGQGYTPQPKSQAGATPSVTTSNAIGGALTAAGIGAASLAQAALRRQNKVGGVQPQMEEKAKSFISYLSETIVKSGSEYCVRSKKGKNLGCSPSRGGAVKRLRQVEYFKHMKEENEQKWSATVHYTHPEKGEVSEVVKSKESIRKAVHAFVNKLPKGAKFKKVDYHL